MSVVINLDWSQKSFINFRVWFNHFFLFYSLINLSLSLSLSYISKSEKSRLKDPWFLNFVSSGLSDRLASHLICLFAFHLWKFKFFLSFDDGDCDWRNHHRMQPLVRFLDFSFWVSWLILIWLEFWVIGCFMWFLFCCLSFSMMTSVIRYSGTRGYK